ncbi:peptidase inhibitor family I36 protein [Streptomyces sp. SPB162]|uniref:peptidase inhibitor family I36 protein n=1 Tax=Streptomyces sp. SPB162 TaxID=2940560 RepID=UPI0024051672|nr:peptidase inhibitor family I36 protein [Streptomyces sp. SPB162]
MNTILTAAALAAALLSVTTPVPASAAPPEALSSKAASSKPASSKPVSSKAACDPGQLCLWGKAGYSSARQNHELADTGIDNCVPLPTGTPARSFVNRIGRPVTTYQSAECATEAEFETYPTGTWVPESRYTVRAFKVWEN